MGKFNIGDKVIVTAHSTEIKDPGLSVKTDLYNKVGTICSFNKRFKDTYGIKFDHYIAGGHNCNGSCENKYGQYINEKYLKLLYDKPSTTYAEASDGNVKLEYIKGENKTMQKKEHEKKTWEQQVKERFENKRAALNERIGFTKENSLVPKKFYYDSKTHTTIIDLGETIGKIKTKPIGDDEYDENVTFNILAAKAIYKRFGITFESDMSSLEAKIFAKYILHKNTGIMFDKYVKYLKDTEQTFLDESAQMKEVEKTRKNQKTKNRARKAKQKAKKQNK